MPVFLARLFGGRPMRREQFLFNDVVTGKPVGVYIDKLDRQWMAEHEWAWFRVPYGRTAP